ncbi:hypothetical protein ACQY0O_001447 [Thecaphora frezii]
MQEHAYGGPALGTHDYAGDELTAAYLPFVGMRCESTKKEGNFTGEVPPRYLSGEDGKRLDDAEINALIKQGEAIIQGVNERFKTPHPEMSRKVIAGNIEEADWMRRVFEVRMRQLLIEATSWRAQSASSKSSNSIKRTSRRDPLSDVALDDVHFHALASNRDMTGHGMPVGDFRVLAVFPPDQQGMRIFVSVGLLSKKKDGDESILSGGIGRYQYADGGAPRRDRGDRGRSGGGRKRIGKQ